jgi:hypothetical protein
MFWNPQGRVEDKSMFDNGRCPGLRAPDRRCHRREREDMMSRCGDSIDTAVINLAIRDAVAQRKPQR